MGLQRVGQDLMTEQQQEHSIVCMYVHTCNIYVYVYIHMYILYPFIHLTKTRTQLSDLAHTHIMPIRMHQEIKIKSFAF